MYKKKYFKTTHLEELFEVGESVNRQEYWEQKKFYWLRYKVQPQQKDMLLERRVEELALEGDLYWYSYL